MLDVNVSDLLLVDREPRFRNVAANFFRCHGYRVAIAGGGEQALRLASEHDFQVAAVDLVMPGMSGIDVLKRLRNNSDCQVIMLAGGEGTIATAVEAMKLGACDLLRKPLCLPDFHAAVDDACRRSQARTARQRSVAAKGLANIVGQSPSMCDVYRLIRRGGPSDRPVLIQGESGTGKELVARALHATSARAQGPFLIINCAALSETLLESELFGHERGAFTGAITAKRGLFEAADGGTLFIDELGEMPLSVQAKLLRVLEDGSFRRVGAVKECHVDIRLLTATNRILAEEVAAKRFREDLYYRINVMSLTLPPLRERGSDIPLLARHFTGDDWKIDPQALQAICRYDWPGNVRQLGNAIERAKILADDQQILAHNLPPEVAGCIRNVGADVDVATPDLKSLKRQSIERVMRREKGNKTRAARALGISRRSLYRLLERYEVASVG